MKWGKRCHNIWSYTVSKQRKRENLPSSKITSILLSLASWWWSENCSQCSQRKVFSNGGRPPAILSISAVCCMYSFCPFVELQFFSLSWICLYLYISSNHSPYLYISIHPTDLRCMVPLCCTLCKALCWAHALFPFGPREFPFLYVLFHICSSLLFAVWLNGPSLGGRHSRASFNLQYWVCKHSGQTLHASSFCSEYLSARVKQLSKRETLAPGRSSYDPKYPSSHRTEANAVLEMRDKQAPYHCGRKFICDCCSKIPTHFLVLPWSFLQHLSSTSTSW